MSDSLEFTVQVRKPGKHWSRSLRRDGNIPAVVYGPKLQNVSIAVPEGQVTKYARSQYDNAIFALKSDDKTVNGVKVLKKEVVVHPVSRRPVHIDFYAIDLTRTLRVFVEVRYEGKAIGLKDGGVMNIVKREVEIECLPTAIPKFLAIDVSNLGVGDSLHASELQIPEGIRLITLPTETLCTIVVIEEEVVAAPVAAAEGAAAAPGAEGAAAAPAAGAEAGKAPAAAAAPKKDEKK